MTQIKEQSAHAAMQGSGFYNENSALQASGISLLMPLWSQVCETASCLGEPLTVADYASSQGRNSMLPVRVAIETLRRRTRPPRRLKYFTLICRPMTFQHCFVPWNTTPAVTWQIRRRFFRRQLE